MRSTTDHDEDPARSADEQRRIAPPRHPKRARRPLRLRWGFVLVAAALPVVWLAPGCGSRTDLNDYEGGGGGGGAGPDAGPDVQTDAPIDVSVDVPIDVPVDVPIDVPVDVPIDVPVDVPIDVPVDVPIDVPVDVPIDVPVDVPIDVPVDVPIDVPVDVPIDVIEDVPIDVPVDVPIDVPVDVPIDVPVDVSIDVIDDGPCPDNDNDGWTTCDGDCNDSNPLVNPGAYDFPNGIDDDCDGPIDNPILDCSGGLQYTSQNAGDYAKAIDICQTTTANATGPNKKWGLISAEFRLADGTGTPAAEAHSIITSFGTVLGPRKNANFVFLSSGLAGTPGQPYYQAGATPQGGTPTMQPGPIGSGGYAMPPGFPTNKQGCPMPQPGAFDPVNLKLTIRVPTNASSFAFDHSFFSAEYPEYACSNFNDIWAVLLDTKAPGIANNKDIVFDAQGTPGSVNLNFFDRCVAGSTGCAGTPGFNFCSGGKNELTGTGYGDPDQGCGPTPTSSSIGGGTGWLTTEAPVVPGETVVVQFMVWDSSDPIYDSSAILDYFRWQTGAIGNPTTHR